MNEQSDNYWIICPHCGHQHPTDVEDYQPDGETWTRNCEKCKFEFRVTVSVDTVWNTTEN